MWNTCNSSNTTSLVEIANNSCELIDPTKIEQISKAIEKILDNIELRKKYVEYGLINIQAYKWCDSKKD
jgi:glycosyltransferase involved in cell wall biosynthesis